MCRKKKRKSLSRELQKVTTQKINESDVPLTERVLRTAGTQKVGTILQESIPKLRSEVTCPKSHKLISGGARIKPKPAYLYTASPIAPTKTQPAPQPTCCSRAISSCIGVNCFETSGGRCRHNALTEAPWRCAIRQCSKGQATRTQTPGALEPPPAPRQLTHTPPCGLAIFQTSHNAPPSSRRGHWANPMFPQRQRWSSMTGRAKSRGRRGRRAD